MDVEDAAMSDVWRLFAAIEVPQAVQGRIAQAVTLLAEAGWQAKWVNPLGTHLTLKFYGDVEVPRLPVLKQALQAAAEPVATFRVEAEGAGVFPSPRRPRVLWLGVGGGDLQTLNRLQAAVDRHSADIGFPAESRAYHPHLTVARFRPEDLVTLADVESRLADLAALPGLPIPVERVTLFRSELRRSGAIYTPLAQFPLRSADR
jgi:2'-5' RNA ligase